MVSHHRTGNAECSTAPAASTFSTDDEFQVPDEFRLPEEFRLPDEHPAGDPSLPDAQKECMCLSFWFHTGWKMDVAPASDALAWNQRGFLPKPSAFQHMRGHTIYSSWPNPAQEALGCPYAKQTLIIHWISSFFSKGTMGFILSAPAYSYILGYAKNSIACRTHQGVCDA